MDKEKDEELKSDGFEIFDGYNDEDLMSSEIVDIDDDIIKKFLITFANSKYKFVLYEEPQLLDEEISINKRELIDQLLNFLTISNSDITMEGLVEM